MTACATAVRTRDLTKRYRDVTAVDRLDLEVACGEVYGLLGRNGAGKTTTIRMLLGLVRPTAGSIELLGRPLRPGETEPFRRVGYLVETATAYPNLTVRENLDVQRLLTGAPPEAVRDAIGLLGLGEYEDRRAGRLSLGNKQRLALARALLHDPALLVLDEPANALDPAGIVEIRELLRSLSRDRGVTVFMSSHILAEVAHLADRIGVLHEGRLLEELDRDELARKARSFIELESSDPGRAEALLRSLGFGHLERAGDRAERLRVFDASERSAEIATAIVGADMELRALTPTQEDLETYFLRITEGGTA